MPTISTHVLRQGHFKGVSYNSLIWHVFETSHYQILIMFNILGFLVWKCLLTVSLPMSKATASDWNYDIRKSWTEPIKYLQKTSWDLLVSCILTGFSPTTSEYPVNLKHWQQAFPPVGYYQPWSVLNMPRLGEHRWTIFSSGKINSSNNKQKCSKDGIAVNL